MGVKKLLCLGLAALVFCSGFPAVTSQARGTEAELQKVTLEADYKADGFWIEDGDLVEYTGKGGDVVVPEGVTSIGWSAFSGCSGLSSITIPDSVTSIGEDAFEGCSSLSNISVVAGNTTYDSRENCNAIIETGSNTLISGCKNTIIPNSVTSIGNYAFSGRIGLSSVSIPEGVTSIGGSAFYGCSSLSSVSIPEGVTSIGYEAFYGCSSLKNITIPKTVTSIGDYALGYDYKEEDGYKKIDGFCITGYSGTKAQAYAKANGFSFVINKAKQKIIGMKTYKKTYGGKPFTLDARLTKGDGKISYSSSNPQVISINQKGKATLRGVGISTITVTAKETKNYSKKAFKVKIEVRPGKPALNKFQTKTGRKLAVSWKRDANATGYEVWCSTDKNFRKDCKKAVIRKNKTVSHKFTGLKAGKKYYVRVCSYKTVEVNGKSQTLKSKWSIQQSKKIQK